MSDHHAARSPSICDWRGRLVRLALRFAAAVTIGFIGGTIGFAFFFLCWIQLRLSPHDPGILMDQVLPGYLESCAAGVYATCFGLLTRGATGRLTGALVAWLATMCAEPMIARIAFERSGTWELVVASVGGLVAGMFIAIYVFLSGLAEQRTKSVGRPRFSLAVLLCIVAGFAVLFAGLQWRGQYQRSQFEDLDSRGVERVKP